MALIACDECGSQVSDKAASCPKCGNPLGGVATAAPPASSAGSSSGGQEVSYYTDQGGVRVTSARVIIGNKTYSLANVSSVGVFTEPAKRGGWILMGLILVVVAAGGFSANNTGCGGGSIFGAIVLFLIAASLNDTHYVRITAAGGEANALSSHDKQYIETVVNAINEAIVKRG